MREGRAIGDPTHKKLRKTDREMKGHLWVSVGHFSLFVLANRVHHDPGAYNLIKMFKQSNLLMCKHAILRGICQGIDAIVFLMPKLIFVCVCVF